MNPRIKELAEQAGMNIVDDKFSTYGKFAEKFAELIVKECISKIENEAAQYAEPVWAVELVNDIKEHFGVEEPKGWICPKCNADRTKIACPLGFGATVDGRCPMTVEAQ